MKLRADLLLVQQNLVSSRARAQALIMAGKVSTSKGRVEKAGELIDENETLILEEDLKYVSRGGLKLEGALQSLHINPQGKICLDVGASTGGFTDCLLQGGAVKVYAVDVGYGQLHYKLREDSRVVMMEKVNFRHFDVNTLEKIDLVVSDVSFISLTKVLGNIHASLKEDGEALVMVKPQFELGPSEVKKGVVRLESLREKAVTLVADFAQKIGFTLLGKSPSPVLGPKGNQEIFLHLKKLKALALLIVMLMSACTSTYKTSRHSPRSKVPSGQDAAYYFILSEIDYRHNRFKQSMTNLNSAIEKAEDEHDTSDYLRFKRAYLSASLNDLKSAEQDARKALQESPQNVNYLVLMGKISHGQQKWTEALNYYESALKLNPQSSEAHSLLIEVLLAQKNYTKALESSRLWQKQDPDDVTPYFYEASLLQNFLNRPQEAVKIYQHILQDDPDSMKALSALADLYVDLKDQKKLLETFHEMEELAPADPGIKIKLALIYYENKDYEKAIQKFEELKKLSPDDDRVIYYLAVMKENTGQGDDAYPLFEQISPKSTFYRDARLHMAFIKKEKGDAVSAIAILEKARKEKKMEPVVTQYLAEIYRDQGKYDKSLSILDESLEQNDKQRSVEDKTLLLYTRGITLDKAGRYDDAIVTMLKILQLDPKNVSALNYVGYTYAEQNKNLDQALDFVAMAYAQKPDDGYIMDSLGWVYFKKGSLEKALNLILKAHKNVPTEPTILEHLGDIYLKRNDKRQAESYYRQSLNLLENAKKKKVNSVEQLGEDKDRERIRQKIENISR